MKRTRAKTSGVQLTEADAALVKGMLARGDRQHDIASWFGVNAGRVAEIATGITFDEVGSAAFDQLPPPGPYLSGKAAHAALAALEAAKSALTTAEQRIRQVK